MFLSFSVTGLFVRPFMQLLQTASKQGEGLFFEPHNDMLQLRAINNAKSTHFLINIAVSHLEAYRCANKQNIANNNNNNNNISPNIEEKEQDEPQEINEYKSNNNEFYLFLPTKALSATVLRQVQNISAVHIRYDGTNTNSNNNNNNNNTTTNDLISTCDIIQWECVMSCGIIKKFALPLSEGKPERAYIPPEHFSFDACAAAKIWGALFGWFPPSTPRVVLRPHSERLEVCVIEDINNNNNNNNNNIGSDGGDTKVVASQEHFLFMHQHYNKQLQQQEEEKEQEEVNNKGLELLPGKIIEVRPLKQVCMLADQLGMMIRVRSGNEGLPVFVEAITVEEAKQAASVLSNTLFTSTDQVNLMNANNIPSISHTNAPSFLNKHTITSENFLRVKFTMYIAAFDVAPVPLETIDGIVTTSTRRSNNSTLTTSGEIMTGTHVPISSVTDEVISSRATTTTTGILVGITEEEKKRRTERGGGGGIILITTPEAPISNPTTPLPHIPSTITEEKEKEANFYTPPRVLVPATPTQGISAVTASVKSPSNSEEVGRLSSSSFTYSSLLPSAGVLVVKGTQEVGSIGMTHSSGTKRARDCVNNNNNNNNNSLDNESNTLVTSSPHCSTNITSSSPSFVAPTIASLNSHNTEQQLQQQQEQQNISIDGGKITPNDRYPLDFNAFMQEIAEETNKEEYEDEDDEALQRFLESCASMLVIPGTQSVNPK